MYDQKHCCHCWQGLKMFLQMASRSVFHSGFACSKVGEHLDYWVDRKLVDLKEDGFLQDRKTVEQGNRWQGLWPVAGTNCC